MTHHVLNATCETVHFGGFSSALPPAIVVQSSDRITVETYTGYQLYEQAPAQFLPPGLIDICQHLPRDRHVSSGPHLLTGPIYIDQAQPGDVLEVYLEQIVPSVPMAFNLIREGAGALPKRFCQTRVRFIELDLERQVLEFPSGSGIQVPLQPFFGVIGVATQDTNRNSIPPGDYGGNMDSRHLQAGSRLWLPVYLPGALLSIGDGHSAQGDGEVSLTAVETSMNGTIQVWVRSHIPQALLPLVETPDYWMTMGFAPSLDEACEQALTKMILLLETYLGLDAEDAYVLCSIAVHFHITQVANAPRRGVHALLPKSLLPKAIAL
ncbi:acetamidase/formamidase family protein [Leptolyngbya sp. AN02str]|uniref:acetamidase/formamidase family protein n=1 Tax=Leptolyngbya sp. AN02str TaxID=3423363 RepID=UPI003D3126B1